MEVPKNGSPTGFGYQFIPDTSYFYFFDVLKPQYKLDTEQDSLELEEAIIPSRSSLEDWLESYNGDDLFYEAYNREQPEI